MEARAGYGVIGSSETERPVFRPDQVLARAAASCSVRPSSRARRWSRPGSKTSSAPRGLAPMTMTRAAPFRLSRAGRGGGRRQARPARCDRDSGFTTGGVVRRGRRAAASRPAGRRGARRRRHARPHRAAQGLDGEHPGRVGGRGGPGPARPGYSLFWPTGCGRPPTERASRRREPSGRRQRVSAAGACEHRPPPPRPFAGR